MRQIIFIFIIFGLASCSQDPQRLETTNVTFNVRVPKASQDDRHGWGGAIPTIANDIECIGIFASYPEDTAKGRCYSPEGSAVLTVSKTLGTFRPTSSQSGSFNSGAARTFYLIGFQSTSGVCTSFSSLNESDLSRPYLLGQTTVNLDGPNATVNLAGTVSTAQEFDECIGGPFSIERDGTYGDGSDGNYTVDGSVSLDTINSWLRYAKIIEIDTTVGNVVKLASPAQATQFSAGDKVMWYVNGFGNSDTNCNTSTIYNRHVGQFDITTVSSVSGQFVTLQGPVVGPADSTVNDYLDNISYASNDPWCQIQLVKIPQFTNLALSSGSTLTTSSGLSMINGYGGILVFAVSNQLIFNGGTISMDGKGYDGGKLTNFSGFGIKGRGTTSAANAGLAATSTAGGGGGGNGAGTGGTGAGSASGGSIITACGPTADCAFMGGGGGTGLSDSIHGGAGGGVIIILAKEIVVNSNSIVSASGLAGTVGSSTAQNGSGGGAGGTIVIKSNEINDLSNLSLISIGGAGGSGESSSYYGGGGGAGGSVHMETCLSFSPGSPILTGGAAGAHSGTSGSAASSGVNSTDNKYFPNICH